MTANSLDLASLLCSRLCHDMLSPVGALNNGIELIAEEKDPEMRKRCFELLEQSAKISADKLKFFRLAFGAAGGYGDMVPVEEARAVVDALAGNNGRIEVNWSFGGDAMPKPAVKTLLNLALIGIESLVRHFVGRQSFDDISDLSGRLLSPDGVHLNSVGAHVVADLAAEFLSAE